MISFAVASFLLGFVVGLVVMLSTRRYWFPVVGWYQYLDEPRHEVNPRRAALVTLAACVLSPALALLLLR